MVRAKSRPAGLVQGNINSAGRGRLLPLSEKGNGGGSGGANLCVGHCSKQTDSSMRSPRTTGFGVYFCPVESG